jgi:hypothetical protein
MNNKGEKKSWLWLSINLIMISICVSKVNANGSTIIFNDPISDNIYDEGMTEYENQTQTSKLPLNYLYFYLL